MKKLLILMTGLLLTAALFTGCNAGGQQQNKEVSIDSIMNAIADAYGDEYLPNMELPEEILEAEFGLTSDMYEEASGLMPMMSTHPDRVVVVKAASGKTDTVVKAFEDARERKINDELQYPMNIPKVDATQVVQEGDYVAFLLVGASLQNLDGTQEEASEYFLAEVNKGVEAFKNQFK